MKQAHFRSYAELNDFLPPGRRNVTFAHAFEGRASVKDLTEAVGVPHTEVDLIRVNGESVDFSHVVKAGDRISGLGLRATRRRHAHSGRPQFWHSAPDIKLQCHCRARGRGTLYGTGSRRARKPGVIPVTGQRRGDPAPGNLAVNRQRSGNRSRASVQKMTCLPSNNSPAISRSGSFLSIQEASSGLVVVLHSSAFQE